MGVTIKQLAATKAAEIKAEAKAEAEKLSKGALPSALSVTETADSKSRAVTTGFFKALASRDSSAMATAQKAVQAEYAAKAQTVDGQTTTPGDQGGILVPLTVDQNIQTQLQFISPIRKYARVISNAPAKLELPSAAGGDAYWVAEATAPTESAVTFKSVNLVPEMLASRIKGITLQFLADVAINPSAQTFLEQQLATKAALEENKAFINGDGANKPFGIRSSAVTPASVDQAGAALAWTDLSAVMFKLPTAYRALGVFMLPSAALLKVINLKDSQGRPIYVQSVSADVPSTILGRPAIIVDEIPANLGTGTDETEIWYSVLSEYAIGDRLGTQFDLGTSGDDFDKAQYTLRMLKRTGGIPTSNNHAVLKKVK